MCVCGGGGGGGGRGGGLKVKGFRVLRPFQEYLTFIEPTINQRWAKTGVPKAVFRT